MLLLGFFLLLLALFFYSTENAFLAVLFLLAGLFVFAGSLLFKSLGFGKRRVKNAAKETEKMEEANPEHPSGELIGEGLKNLGEKAGDHAFLEKNVWTFSSKDSNVRERVGKSSKNFIDKFFELFT